MSAQNEDNVNPADNTNTTAPADTVTTAPADTVTLTRADYDALVNAPAVLLGDILAGKGRKALLTAVLVERNKRIYWKGASYIPSEAEVSEAGRAIPPALIGDLLCAFLTAHSEDPGAVLAEKHVADERESVRKYAASTANKRPAIKRAPLAVDFAAAYLRERSAQEAAAKGAAGAAKSAGARSAGGRATDAE
jgi:hypothetical protein